MKSTVTVSPAQRGPPHQREGSSNTCSAVVAQINDQRSIELRLLNGKGWMPVGTVTIPDNEPVPTVGSVVEIRYLCAFRENNALCQPVFLGERCDIEQHECVLSQLKYQSAGAEKS